MKHVYIMIREDGAIKIGVSGNPEVRKISVSREVRKSVDLSFCTKKREDAYKIEKMCHEILEEKHETGEWFWASVDDAFHAIDRAIFISNFITNLDESTISNTCYKRRNISLTKPQIKALEEIRLAREVPFPQVVRDAIDEYVENRKKKELTS